MLWCSRTCKESVLRAPCIKYSIRSCSSCHTAAKNSQTNSSSVTWCGQHLGDTKSHMGNENYNFPSQCRAGALSECTLGSFQYLFHLMVELACIMVLLSVWVPCYPVSVSFFSVFPSITVFLFCSLLFFSIEESQFPSSATKGTPGIWLPGGGDSEVFVRAVEVTTIFSCSFKFSWLCANPLLIHSISTLHQSWLSFPVA